MSNTFVIIGIIFFAIFIAALITKYSSKRGDSKTKQQKKEDLAVFVALTFILSFLLLITFTFCSACNHIKESFNEGDSDSKSGPKSNSYYITETGHYCVFTESDFDLYLDIVNAQDAVALATLAVDGRAVRLQRGQRVYLVDHQWLKSKIRLKGSTYPCYVVSDAIESY